MQLELRDGQLTGRLRALVLGVGMLLLAACGGSPASNSGANPLQAMSLQADDVPEFKAKNLTAWDVVRSTWYDLQHPGATDGWWQLYATAQTACDTYFAQGGYAFSQETPLVTRVMISTTTQFPDPNRLLRRQ